MPAILKHAGPNRCIHVPLLPTRSDPAADVSAFKARGGHVLIGTPGRIDDVIKRCTAMDLRRLEVGGEGVAGGGRVVAVIRGCGCRRAVCSAVLCYWGAIPVPGY